MNDTKIRFGMYYVIIIVGHGKIVPNNDLKWNLVCEETGEYGLTLGEISDQLIKLGHEGAFCVWEEKPLSGTIYIYGNHSEQWQVHGTTKGYA
jgi:hypothetical protein